MKIKAKTRKKKAMFKEEQPVRKRDPSCLLCQKPKEQARMKVRVLEWKRLCESEGRLYSELPLEEQRDLLNAAHNDSGILDRHQTHAEDSEELRTLTRLARAIRNSFQLHGHEMTREEWIESIYGKK